MDRRNLLAAVALAAVCAPRAGHAQQPQASAEDLLRIASDPIATEQLLQEMDALWGILALALTRRAGRLPRPDVRTSYFQFRAQIANPDARRGLIAALQTPDGRERAEQISGQLASALGRLPGALSEAGIVSGAPLANQLIAAFRTFTQLLNARTNSDGWWCRVYGLELFC